MKNDGVQSYPRIPSSPFHGTSMFVCYAYHPILWIYVIVGTEHVFALGAMVGRATKHEQSLVTPW